MARMLQPQSLSGLPDHGVWKTVSKLKGRRVPLSSQIALVVFQNQTPAIVSAVPRVSFQRLPNWLRRTRRRSRQGCRRRTSTSWRITLPDKLRLGGEFRPGGRGGLFALVSRCFGAMCGARRPPMRGWNYRGSVSPTRLSVTCCINLESAAARRLADLGLDCRVHHRRCSVSRRQCCFCLGGLRTERPAEAIKPHEVFGTPRRIAFFGEVCHGAETWFSPHNREDLFAKGRDDRSGAARDA